MCPKYLVLLGFLPFFTTNLVAQQAPIGQSSRWSVDILAGLNIPTGKFGGKDLADSTKSFAQVGPSINLQLNYRLHTCFGLSLLVSGQENTVNTSAMDEQVEKANPGEFANFSSGQWQIGKVMAGPTFFRSIGKGRWEFTVKGMAGALKTAEPKMTFLGEESSDPGGSLGSGSSASSFEYYKGKQPAPWAFSWLAGAGTRFRINDRWSFLVDMDYSAASIKVPYVGSNAFLLTPAGGTSGTLTGGTPPTVIAQPGSQRYYSLPVTSLSAHFGMEFRF